MKKVGDLLKNRYFWYAAVMAVLAGTFAYTPQLITFFQLPFQEGQQSAFILAVYRSLLIFSAAIAAWRFGVKGGLLVCLITGAVILSSYLVDLRLPNAWIDLGAIALGFLLSWLVGAQGEMKKRLEKTTAELRQQSSVLTSEIAERKQAQEKLPVNINDDIRKVIELRSYEQKINNIRGDARLAPDLPKITGNSSQLQQVFFNLIVNAEFFMLLAHKKGALTITTEKAGNSVRASFADDGPGIEREIMRQLFNPFFSTKAPEQGTGLGLSICHGIITEHGGRIWAESEPGKGAAFSIELPAGSPKT